MPRNAEQTSKKHGVAEATPTDKQLKTGNRMVIGAASPLFN
jgi:hypothetical protein